MSLIQYISIFGSLFVLIFIFELIRKKKIKEQYSILWIFFSIIFLFFSIWRDALEKLSNIIGIVYAPAALFLLLIIAIFAVLIHFSISISKLIENTKDLTQEIGMLKHDIGKLKEKKNNLVVSKKINSNLKNKGKQ